MRNLRSTTAALTSVLLTVMFAVGGAPADAAPAGIATASCGDPDASGSTTATDALMVLRAGVGLASCDDCICNVNGVGAVTATDALLLLRISVGSEVQLACAVCPSVRFRIASTTTCIATHVKIPASALPAGLTAEDCAVAPGAAALPCDAKLEVGEDGLVIDIRHSDDAPFEKCLLNSTLFSCGVTQEAASTMIAAATVSCPCNCLLVCPSFGLCDEANEDCLTAPTNRPTLSAAAPRSAPANPAVEGTVVEPPVSPTPVPVAFSVSTTAAPQPTSTSTTFCGTCCNMEELGQVEVVDAPPVLTEILMRVSGDTTEFGCLDCGSDIMVPGREQYIEHEDEDSALICIIDHHGIAEPGKVANCVGYGDLASGPAEVLRANGINFEPLDTLPAVNLSKP